MAAASTWGPLWTGLRIHFHCDNLPISRPGQDSPQNSLNSCNCSKPCALGQPSTVSPSIPEITYPCSLLLSPRRTLDQYQLHTTGPRSELTSPTPTGQSCSPIYENYSIGIRCYQVLPGTNETVTLFAAHLSLSLHSKTIRCVVESLFCITPWGTEAPSPGYPILSLPSEVSST